MEDDGTGPRCSYLVVKDECAQKPGMQGVNGPDGLVEDDLPEEGMTTLVQTVTLDQQPKGAEKEVVDNMMTVEQSVAEGVVTLDHSTPAHDDVVVEAKTALEKETDVALDHPNTTNVDDEVEGRTTEVKQRALGTRMVCLVEPGSGDAPTKRRRGKGRKKPDGFRQGTLQNFIFKPKFIKDCTTKTTFEVEPEQMRKRKRMIMVEDPMESKGTKSRRTMVDKEDVLDGTLTSSGNLRGAKSFSETERRHLKGLDLIGVEKEGSRLPGELTTRRTNI